MGLTEGRGPKTVWANPAEIIRSLAGAQERSSGTVCVWADGGHSVAVAPGSVAAAVRCGVALLPEDRKGEGLYLDLSIEDNIWLGPLRQTPLLRRAPRDPGLAAQRRPRRGRSRAPCRDRMAAPRERWTTAAAARPRRSRQTAPRPH